MANLSSVQSQIDILNSGNEYQKKQVLEPKNIQDVRTFIAEKKGKPGWEAHEKSFQDWENLISKYNTDRGAIVAGTAEAVGGTPRPQYSIVLDKSIPIFDNRGKLDPWKQLPKGKEIILPFSPIEQATIINGNNKITLSQVMVDNKKIWVWKGDIPSYPTTSQISGAPQVVGAIGPTQSTGVEEIRESLQEINPENLEKAIIMSENIINLIPSKDMQYTLRGVHGTIIIQALRQAGHNLVLRNNQIEIIPKPGIDTVNLSKKLQALVNTGKLPIESIKVGLLYGSKVFEEYSNLQKIRDTQGAIKINPRASIQEYIQYVQDRSKAGDTSLDIDSIMASRAMLSGVDMQKAIRGFQDLGQVQAIFASQSATSNSPNPSPLAPANAPNPSPIGVTHSPISSPSVPANPPQSDNTLTGSLLKDGVTGGRVTGVASDATHGLMSGLGDIMSLGKGDPIATLGIGAALIYGIYKAFSKFGFLGGLGALFGAGAMNNYEKILARFGETPTASTTTPPTAPVAATTPVAVAAATAATAPAVATSSVDISKLTPSQKKVYDTISADTTFVGSIDTFADKQIQQKRVETAKSGEYMKYIFSEDFQKIPLEKYIYTNNVDISVFRPTETLDPSLKVPSNLNNSILKKMILLYLTGSTKRELILGKQLGDKEKDAFETKYPSLEWKSKTLSEITPKIYQ